MALEQKVLAMIKAVYSDSTPESWTIRAAGQSLDVFRDVFVRLNRTVTADGEGIRLKEFILGLRANSKHEHIELDERDFLLPALTKNALAIYLDHLILRQGEQVRLFICEKTAGTAEPDLFKATAPVLRPEDSGVQAEEDVKRNGIELREKNTPRPAGGAQ